MNIQEIDKKIIDFIQDGYLYIWDRFGITLGHLLSVYGLILLSYDLIPFTTILDIVVDVAQILYGVYRSNLQINKNYAEINSTAEWFRGFVGTCMRILWWFIFFLYVRACYLGIGDFHTIAGIANWIVLYLWCVKVRDRDPSNVTKLKFAHVRN